MSPTPPIPSRSPAPSDSSAGSAAGDGIKLNVVQARGAQRTGAIWILVISLTLAIVLIGAYWLTQAPRMQAVNHPSGRDLNTHDVRNLYPPQAAPATSNSATAN